MRRRRAEVRKDGNEYEIAGRVLSCHHCQHKEFTRRLALMNTSGLSMLGLDFANKDAVCYVCDQCGFVHWFRE
jgi:hypothetical protein